MNILNKTKNFFKKIGDSVMRKSYNQLFQSRLLKNDLNWGKGEFLKKNAISLYVNKAIKKRAEKVAQTKWYIKKGDEIIDDVNNEVLDLLNHPNDFHNGLEFWELYQRYKDITGCAFIWKEKGIGDMPAGLHLLRPDLVTIMIADGEIGGYKFKKSGGEEVIYDPEEIIYSFHPDPLKPLEGESIIQAGSRIVDTQNQIDEYQNAILKNGGKVEGVFKVNTSRLSKQQLTELKKDYQEKYGQARKAGLPLFLSGDMDYKRLGLTPSELDYLETKKMTLNDIVIMTGVPKSVLGSVDDVKYSNAEQSEISFMKHTIKPLVDNLKAVLNQHLIEDKDIELGFVSPVPENKEEKRKDLETGKNVNALTINEMREELGRDPIDGGDRIFGAMNQVPILDFDLSGDEKKKSISKSPACRMRDETQSECVSRKIPELKEEGYSQEQAEAIAINMCENACSEKMQHPLKNKSFRKRYGQIQDKKLSQEEIRAASVFRKYFKEQEERLLELVEASQDVPTLVTVFDRDEEEKLARKEIEPILREVLVNSGQDTLEFSKQFMKANIEDFLVDVSIKVWLSERSRIFSKEITETTFNQLQEVFRDSLKEKNPRQALIKGIKETYSGYSENRAKTIARTEIHGAFQKGNFEAYKQAQIPIKIWVTVGDARVRSSHAMADGEEVPINQPFSNGLQFPGDPNGSAGDIINCRCQI